MVRQCAWCLRLIDDNGERISLLPLPKLYDASHGMCGICGRSWMEEVMGEQREQQTQGTKASSEVVGEAEKEKVIDTEELTPIPQRIIASLLAKKSR